MEEGDARLRRRTTPRRRARDTLESRIPKPLEHAEPNEKGGAHAGSLTDLRPPLWERQGGPKVSRSRDAGTLAWPATRPKEATRHPCMALPPPLIREAPLHGNADRPSGKGRVPTPLLGRNPHLAERRCTFAPPDHSTLWERKKQSPVSRGRRRRPPCWP